MSLEPTVLEVYQTGPLTVVGFGGRQILHDISLAPLHDDLLELVDEHDCTELAFDLTGVQFIPSGLLGILASVRKKGVAVHVYNPSEDVRDALHTTKLDTVFTLHDVELE